MVYTLYIASHIICHNSLHAGLKYCKINVHLLSHLPRYVKLFGPLWTHSAFGFEDSIRHLVKKAHGTHDIANQVLWRGNFVIIIITNFHTDCYILTLQWRLHVQCKLMHDTPNLTAFVSSLTSRQTYAYFFEGTCHNLRFFYSDKSSDNLPTLFLLWEWQKT